MMDEGARSVNGAYLQLLGASAAMVGFTAGLGELIGYGFRSVTGFVSDRTGKYWVMTISGHSGKLFDRVGIEMIVIAALSAFFAPLVFLLKHDWH